MRPHAALLFTPLVCATASMIAPRAFADAPTASGVAQGLFEEARDEMRRGDYSSACPKLAESQRLDPSSGTLLNLLLCEEGMGKVASAWLHAKELCDTLSDRDDRKPIAERKLAELAARVPKLAVRLPSTAPAGTTLTLDGVELGPSSLGVPVPVDPRTHRLVVDAPGRPERVVEIELREGQQIEWLADVAPEARVTPEATPSVAPGFAGVPETAPGVAVAPSPLGGESTRSLPWERWVAFGVGAAGFAAGAVLGVLALERRATVIADCPGKQCKDSSGLDAASEGQRFFAGALAATGVGLAGTGLGVYLVLRDPRPSPTHPPPGSVRLSIAPSGAIATCQLAF